jgi:hypothetical protein
MKNQNVNNMADFSKQWCELNDPEMSWDFDIVEEGNKLKPNSYTSVICEGFGFIAIGKGDHDEIIVECESLLQDDVKQAVETCMLNGGNAYLENLEIKADASIGSSWYEAK